MARRRGGVVVRRVAAIAGVRCVRVVAVVASGAVVRNRCVCTVQYIKIIVNGEGRRLPIRRRSVARGTVVRQV